MSESITYENPVPAAVRRASERADELIQAAAAPADDTTVGVEPPAQPDAPTTEVVTESAPGAPSEPAASTLEWEQRYRTIQGKYDAEVPALHGQVRAMQAQIASMQELLARPPAPPPAQPAAAPAQTPVVSDKDREEYGELVDKVGGWVKPLLAEEVARFKAELEAVKQQVASQRVQSAEQRVHAALDAAVPNWRTINMDPRFIGWLDTVDPFAGRPLRQMLGDAYNSGDGARTARFFEKYLAEQTISTSPPAPGHTAAAAAPAVDLAALAAPGRGTPASGARQADKRTWSRQDITTLYARHRRGEFAGREDDFRRLEQDMFDAQREGRLINR